MLFRFAPAGCRGSGAGPLWWSGAAPLGHPLDYHPRSVVNWLTRWTFGNSSCKPVTCSAGGGLLFCPLFEQFRPNPPLDGFGELEKLFAHAVHSFRLTRNRSGLSSGSLAVATWYHAETRLSSVEPRNLRFAQKAWNHVVQNAHGTTPTNLV